MRLSYLSPVGRRARLRVGCHWLGQCKSRPSAGVTLVELLVVVAIIGALVALVLPGVQAARESARRAHCQSNVRQLGVAMTLHAQARGAYPIGCIGCKPPLVPSDPPRAPQRFISWNLQLLPLLEESALHESFDFDLPSYHASNKRVAAAVVSVFLCPGTAEPLTHCNVGLWKGAAFTDFGGLYGIEGPGYDADPNDPTATQWLRNESLGVLVYEEPVAPQQVTDGLSKTASIAEMSARRLPTETEWVNGHNVFAQQASTPINGPVVQINEIGSPHPGGASLVFCDGHVQFVSEAVEQAVLNAMLTRAGND